MWEDLGGVKFCNTFGVDGLLAGNKDTGFADVMVCDGEDSVEALGLWKLGDEVNCDGLKG